MTGISEQSQIPPAIISAYPSPATEWLMTLGIMLSRIGGISRKAFSGTFEGQHVRNAQLVNYRKKEDNKIDFYNCYAVLELADGTIVELSNEQLKTATFKPRRWNNVIYLNPANPATSGNNKLTLIVNTQGIFD